MSLIMELDKTKDSRKSEEDQHGVQQDESGDAEPSDIYGKSAQFGCIWNAA